MSHKRGRSRLNSLSTPTNLNQKPTAHERSGDYANECRLNGLEGVLTGFREARYARVMLRLKQVLESINKSKGSVNFTGGQDYLDGV